ncbi:MAG: hypothetical protein VYE22_16780 [Myxococcota bacterium]|nr:hypothetical protein [Myxococcota bacterium]
MDTFFEVNGVSVDSSQRPIVLVRYPPSFDATSYRKLFEHYAELAAEGRPIAWLVDFTAFNPVTASASLRKEAAVVFEEYLDVLEPVSICEARVVASGVARGILTAFDWLTGSKWPTVNVSSFEEAHAFIDDHLKSR